MPKPLVASAWESSAEAQSCACCSSSSLLGNHLDAKGEQQETKEQAEKRSYNASRCSQQPPKIPSQPLSHFMKE